MLIRRCAWHRGYHGYPIVFGIASWRGLHVSFTDGMCLRCTSHFRRQWNLPETRTRPAPLRSAHTLARAAVIVLVAGGFSLAERQANESGTGGTLTAPPETVLVPPAPVEEGPPRALAIAHRPRRIRRPVSIEPLADAPRPALFAEQPLEAMAAPMLASIAEPAPPAIRPRSPIPPPELVLPEITAARRTPVRAPVDLAAVPHAGLTQQAP